jgi:spore coat polysaccharide biosynthesis protein SpsF
MRKRIVGIIPARLDSSRLPGKGLLKIKGKAALHYLVSRLQHVEGINDVVIATTRRECDKPLVEWAVSNKIRCHKGSLDDVLGRFYGAALEYDADIAIKANGDCPLLSPEVINMGIRQCVCEEYEFLTGKNQYTGLPFGLGAEIIMMPALSRLEILAKTDYHRDNITTYIFENPKKFHWAPINVLQKWKAPRMSLTLDTADDLKKIKRIIEGLGGSIPGEWKIEEIIEISKNS